VRFDVRPEAHAVRFTVLRGTLKVPLQDVQIDEDGRCIEVADPHSGSFDQLFK